MSAGHVVKCQLDRTLAPNVATYRHSRKSYSPVPVRLVMIYISPEEPPIVKNAIPTRDNFHVFLVAPKYLEEP